MKELTETLLAAQRSPGRQPYVTLRATNKVAGVIRSVFEQLYSGSEPDTPHAMAVAGDGSLIRFRITPSDDAARLLRQRVANPGPDSNFSQWVDTGTYNVLAVGAAVIGNTVSVFWLDGNRAIYHQRSTDNGVTWATPERIGSTTSTIASGIAAAYKDNGDIAVFFTDMEIIYVIKFETGEWQLETAWDKTTGYLSGIAAVYDGDFNLLVTGQDSAGNYRAWSLVYGDGPTVPAGTWSDLKEVAAADAGVGYEFLAPFMTRSDVIRACFVEKFTGIAAYDRFYTTNIVPGSNYAEGFWSEPLPFNFSCENGLAIAYRANSLWLACPSAVFSANMSEATLDLSAGILSLREVLKEGESRLTVELMNGDGRFCSGIGSPGVLAPGCGLEVGFGYVTAAGAEVGMTLSFRLDALEYNTGAGKASLILHASGGWETLAAWRAHTQFRWNKSGAETPVKDIMSFVLGRAGIPLEASSASATAAGFSPDFTVHTGECGDGIVRELLNLLPDALIIVGSEAILLEPVSSEPVYTYGDVHAVLEGRFVELTPGITHVRVEGIDAITGLPIVTESFNWETIERGIERPFYIEDRNIGSEEEAAARGETCLRKAQIRSEGGVIRAPLNCGQELYDIIEITGAGMGLSAEKRRVLGMEMRYDTGKGIYEQKLYLGAV